MCSVRVLMMLTRMKTQRQRGGSADEQAALDGGRICPPHPIFPLKTWILYVPCWPSGDANGQSRCHPP